MEQPPGFQDEEHPHYVSSLADTSLFVQKLGKRLTILLVYVDDILVTGNDTTYITAFISELNNHFHVKDLGALHYFLGLEVLRNSSGIFLSQSKYILDLLKKTNMVGCKHCSSPAVANSQLTYEGELLPDPTSYRSIVGALHYLTWSRPEISFAVLQVCQFEFLFLFHFSLSSLILRECKNLRFVLLMKR
ncbi:uncharacterized protein LOC113312153 [Papaver somniferum]|uniref:uncharacterized protein LOC113312153 n=1 Tax=Papaver somniferum TaxID=3469 RepID=UPI000E704086|nr:uncharacterized protein LOC113312153 [Papaver somniferum]